MRANVLVIEDNQANLQLLTFLLSAFGHHATGVNDGLAALEAMNAAIDNPIDLILCDLQLPVMDGYALARRIKAEPRFREVPLVAVTASAMPGDREKALAAGCDGYIAKPIVPEQFMSQIDPFLPSTRRVTTPVAADLPRRDTGEEEARPPASNTPCDPAHAPSPVTYVSAFNGESSHGNDLDR